MTLLTTVTLIRTVATLANFPRSKVILRPNLDRGAKFNLKKQIAMNQITQTGQMYGEAVTVRRITKKEARALFCAGIEIYLQSSNMMPFGPWQSLCPVELDKSRINSAHESKKFCEKNNLPVSPCAELTPAIQFNNVVNEFQWYNCDNERGKYAAFYVKSNF